jgi:hypothetical protein
MTCIFFFSVLQCLSKQRYESGESGVFSSLSNSPASSCPCGGCNQEESNTAALYIPSSYITNRYSQIYSPLT